MVCSLDFLSLPLPSSTLQCTRTSTDDEEPQPIAGEQLSICCDINISRD